MFEEQWQSRPCNITLKDDPNKKSLKSTDLPKLPPCSCEMFDAILKKPDNPPLSLTSGPNLNADVKRRRRPPLLSATNRTLVSKPPRSRHGSSVIPANVHMGDRGLENCLLR
jgi:hypothetical protein